MSRTSAAKRSPSIFRSELELLERRDTPGSLLGDLAVLLAPPLLGNALGRLGVLPTIGTTTFGGGSESNALPVTFVPSDDAKPLTVTTPVQSQASAPTGLGVGTVSGVVAVSSLDDSLLNVAFASGSGVFVGTVAQSQPRPAAADAGQLLAPLPASQSDTRPASSGDLAGASVSTPVFTGVNFDTSAQENAPSVSQFNGPPTLRMTGFTINSSNASSQYLSGQRYSNYAAHSVPAINALGRPKVGVYYLEPQPAYSLTVSVSSGMLMRGIPNAGGFEVQHAPSFTFSGLVPDINYLISTQLWFVNPAKDFSGSVTLSVTGEEWDYRPTPGSVTSVGQVTRTATWQTRPYDDGSWLATRENLHTVGVQPSSLAAPSSTLQTSPSNTLAVQPTVNKQIVKGIDLNYIKFSYNTTASGEAPNGTKYTVYGSVWTADTCKGRQIKLFQANTLALQPASSQTQLKKAGAEDITYNCHGYTFGLSNVMVGGVNRSFEIADAGSVTKLVEDALTEVSVSPADGSFPPVPAPTRNQTVFVFYNDGRPEHSCVLYGDTYNISKPWRGTWALDPDATRVVTKNNYAPLKGMDGTVTIKATVAENPGTTTGNVKMYIFQEDAIPPS